MLAGFLDMPVWLRICLIIYGFLICVFGIGVAVVYDVNVGSFECGYCGKKFAPTLKAYIFSIHTLTARPLN